MTNPTSNFGWQMPTSTDLVTDLPADFEVFGQAVDTSLADLKGGTTGQILSKTSNTDMDFTWVAPTTGDITGVTAGTGISGGGTSGDVTITNSMATTITTNGDLIYGTGSGTFTRRGIGSTGDVLTVSGGVPTWSAPVSGGMTLISTTTLSAATTTISSIPSTYKNLQLIIADYYPSSNGAMSFRLNGDTTSKYNYLNATAGSGLNGNSAGRVTSMLIPNHTIVNTNQNNILSMTIYDYTNAFSKVLGGFTTNTDAQPYSTTFSGSYQTTSAISSISIITNTASWTAGTAYLYGVK